MLLSITTFYLVIAGLNPYAQLCPLFSMSYVSHIKENSLRWTNWPSSTLIHVPVTSLSLQNPPGYENIGVGLLKDSSLMGTFPIPPPDVPHLFVASINMISTSVRETPVSYDLWIIPNLDNHLRYGDQMPLSPVKSTYQAIQSTTPSTPSLGDLSPDPFRIIFPTDEMIMSVMSMEDTPWDNGHHCSILFLEKHTMRVTNGSRPHRPLLSFLLFPSLHTICSMKGN
jgi:hypothetical protein